MEKIISIGSRLRQEREAMEKTQSDFAAIASAAGVPGSTRQSQAKYEKGLTSPSAAYLAAIGDAGADVLYILTGRKEVQRVGYPPLVSDFLLRVAVSAVGKGLWLNGLEPEKFAPNDSDDRDPPGLPRGYRLWLMTLVKLAVQLYNSTEWVQGSQEERESMAYGMALYERNNLDSAKNAPIKPEQSKKGNE